jgi:hypothetical protein
MFMKCSCSYKTWAIVQRTSSTEIFLCCFFNLSRTLTSERRTSCCFIFGICQIVCSVACTVSFKTVENCTLGAFEVTPFSLSTFSFTTRWTSDFSTMKFKKVTWINALLSFIKQTQKWNVETWISRPPETRKLHKCSLTKSLPSFWSTMTCTNWVTTIVAISSQLRPHGKAQFNSAWRNWAWYQKCSEPSNFLS